MDSPAAQGSRRYFCGQRVDNDEHRVRTPITEGPSHRTVLVLFTYGSSGRWVVNPIASRFTTSVIQRQAPVAPTFALPCAPNDSNIAAIASLARVHSIGNCAVPDLLLACDSVPI